MAPPKNFGYTFSLEGWMGERIKKGGMTEKKNKIHLLSVPQFYQLCNTTVMISLIKRFYVPPGITEGYKYWSSLLKVISFTGAGGAGTSIVFASVFQSS